MKLQNSYVDMDTHRGGHLVIRTQEALMNDLLPVLQRNKLTLLQYILLLRLRDENKPLSMTEIAGCMQHTTAAATGLIDRMEQNLMLVRYPSKDDRRQIFVKISAKGLSLLESIDAEQRSERVLECLTPQERSIWAALHQKVLGLIVAAGKVTPFQELVAV